MIRRPKLAESAAFIHFWLRCLMTSTRIRTIGCGASYGATVWAIYGIVEGAFVVFVPAVRHALAAVVPSTVSVAPFISVTLTALALTVYPVVGGLLGMLMAILLVITDTGRGAVLKADSGTLWSSIGGLTLSIAFGLNALAANQASVAPAALAPMALATLGVVAAWRHQWRDRRSGRTHPLTIVLTLVGVALITEPRWYVGPFVRAILAIGYTALVLSLGAGLHRAWTSTRWGRGVGDCLPRAQVSLVVLSCATLTWTLLASSPQRPPVRPLSESRTGRTRDDRPNIILITLDTVRADHLSVYGYGRDTTPNLRRMAVASGTVYTHAVASSNWTLPTHASIFTGLNPARHGVHPSPKQPAGFQISAQSATLPALLSQQGYRTAGIVANFRVLNRAGGFDRGFASYEIVALQDFLTLAGRPYLLLASVRNLAAYVLRHEDLYARAAAINKRAASFLDETARTQQPFFLFLNYMDAHHPYVPPRPFDGRYAGKDPAFRWRAYEDMVEEVSVRRVRAPRDRESRHLISQYDGALAYLDDQLEQLFQKLRSLNLFDNSLIIVTADHGEAFGESWIFMHGLSVYQHQVHVPLIIKYPHSSKGATVDAWVSSVDIFPTIVDVVGAPMPRNIDGESLRWVERLSSRWVISESYAARGPGFTSSDARPSEIALFSGSFKQILGAGGATELYDLSIDPNENTNVYGRRAVPKEFQARLAAYMEEARSQSPARTVTDRDALERLRSLGYAR